jgi:hypothetical protein
MKIGRWFAVIAIATVCVMVFVQGGVADAASSATRHVVGHAAPAPAQHRADATTFGTTSTVPLQIIDTRYATSASATSV